MPSPYPGMDPYLEGYLFPDLLHALISQISAELNRVIVPKYVSRIAVRTALEELEAHSTTRTTLHAQVHARSVVNATNIKSDTPSLITPASAVVSQPFLYKVEIPSIEIRDVASGTLITCIEILLPLSKKGEGWKEYQFVRVQVMNAQAHLVEIDLLRQGQRHVLSATTPRAPYYAFLTRARKRTQVEVWAMRLRETLPTIPVPLRAPDADVPLDLQAIFTSIYDRARYDLSIDYRKPPEHLLNDDDAEWATSLLKQETK